MAKNKAARKKKPNKLSKSEIALRQSLSGIKDLISEYNKNNSNVAGYDLTLRVYVQRVRHLLLSNTHPELAVKVFGKVAEEDGIKLSEEAVSNIDLILYAFALTYNNRINALNEFNTNGFTNLQEWVKKLSNFEPQHRAELNKNIDTVLAEIADEHIKISGITEILSDFASLVYTLEEELGKVDGFDTALENDKPYYDEFLKSLPKESKENIEAFSKSETEAAAPMYAYWSEHEDEMKKRVIARMEDEKAKAKAIAQIEENKEEVSNE